MTNFKALSQSVPPHDYQAARQGALSWLGKRYLLAEPLNRRMEDKTLDLGKAQRAESSLLGVGA